MFQSDGQQDSDLTEGKLVQLRVVHESIWYLVNKLIHI